MNATFAAFLETQRESAVSMAAESDIFDVSALDAQTFILRFRCRGLVRAVDDSVIEVDSFDVGLRFPLNYLSESNSGDILTLLNQPNIFMSNALGTMLCIGPIEAGTPITDLIYRTFEVLSGQNVRTDDALNPPAAAFAFRNPNRFPVDSRPLKRRSSVPERSQPGTQPCVDVDALEQTT